MKKEKQKWNRLLDEPDKCRMLFKTNCGSALSQSLCNPNFEFGLGKNEKV